MKGYGRRILRGWCGGLLAVAGQAWAGGDRALADGAGPARERILRTIERVADWQIAHPAAYSATAWTQAAFYAGVMSLPHFPRGSI